MCVQYEYFDLVTEDNNETLPDIYTKSLLLFVLGGTNLLLCEMSHFAFIIVHDLQYIMLKAMQCKSFAFFDRNVIESNIQVKKEKKSFCGLCCVKFCKPGERGKFL